MDMPVASVMHGIADPTYASRAATDIESPATPTWTEQERARILQIRDTIQARIQVEVNRMEGQLSLMMSHLEGTYDSRLAKLLISRRIVPLFIGFVLGAVLTKLFS